MLQLRPCCGRSTTKEIGTDQSAWATGFDAAIGDVLITSRYDHGEPAEMYGRVRELTYQDYESVRAIRRERGAGELFANLGEWSPVLDLGCRRVPPPPRVSGESPEDPILPAAVPEAVGPVSDDLAADQRGER